MVARFSANFSENCSEAVGQQREIQNHASLLVQLSSVSQFCRMFHPKGPYIICRTYRLDYETEHFAKDSAE